MDSYEHTIRFSRIIFIDTDEKLKTSQKSNNISIFLFPVPVNFMMFLFLRFLG